MSPTTKSSSPSQAGKPAPAGQQDPLPPSDPQPPSTDPPGPVGPSDPGVPYPVPDPGVPYPVPDPGGPQAPPTPIDRAPAPPYGAYAAITGSFVGGIALVAVGARRRALPNYTPLDAAMLGLATFKAARTLARDGVTSFIREPFVEGTPADPKDEHPVRTGDLRQAIGEMVTCTRCVGTWAAAGLVATEALAPSFGRVLIRSLALGGANDWLQAGFSAVTARANRLQA